MDNEKLIVDIEFITKAGSLEELMQRFRTLVQQIANTPIGTGAGTSLRDLQRAQDQAFVAASRTAKTKFGVAGGASQFGAQLQDVAQENDIRRLIGQRQQEQRQQRFGTKNPELAKQLQSDLDDVKRRAKRLEIAGGDSDGAKEFRSALVRETRARQLLSAKLQEELALTDAYANAKAREITARNRVAAQVSRGQQSNEAIAAAAEKKIEARRTSTRQENAALSGLTPEDIEREAALEYVKRKTAVRRAQAENDLLQTASGQKLLQEEGQLAAARQRQAQTAKTAEAEERASNSGPARQYRAEKARQIRAQASISASIQEELASNNALAKSKAREATARSKVDIQVAKEQQDPGRIAIEANKRLEARRLKQLQEQGELDRSTPQDTQREAKLALSRREKAAERAQAETQLLATPQGQQLIKSEGEVAAARARQAAEIQAATAAELAADSKYIAATAATKAAREEQAARISLVQAGASQLDAQGNPLQGEQLLARAAVADRIKSDVRATAVANELSNVQNGAIQAAVARRNAEAKLRAAETQLERAYIREALGKGQLEGTPFQKLQARLSPNPRAPLEFQKGGEFLGQRVLATAAYGVGATAFYGAISGIGNLLQEAEKLQQIFVQIDNQLNSLGKGAATESVKNQVLDIAKTTGVASDEVGKVAFQFLGAFGGDVPKALEETASAMKLVQVTGLELTEVVDSLTAITKTFGVNIEEIGDTTLGLQERFGVLSKEIVTFVGDTASVASEAGLSFKDLASIAAVAQQQSGKSGATLAEQFNRIIPALGDSKAEILSIYGVLAQGDAYFAQSQKNIIGALGQGNNGDVFKQIVADYDKLQQAGKSDSVVSQLGGRREAQTLIPILRANKQLTAEFNANQKEGTRDAGKLQSKFEDIQATLANTGQRLSESLKQIGEALISSGVGEILAEIGNALASALQAGKGFFEVLSQINNVLQVPKDFLGGAFSDAGLGQAVRYGVTVALLVKLFGQLNNLRRSSLTTSVQTAAAEGTEAAARTANTEASVAETAALQAETAAETANTASAATNAEANAAQAGSRALNPYGTVVAGAPIAPVQELGPYARLGQRASGFANRLPFYGTQNPNAIRNVGLAPQPGQGVAIAAIVAAGAIQVHQAYSEQREGIEGAAKSLKEKLSKADQQTLTEIANSNTDFMERASIRFFGQELPEELARHEQGIRASAGGREKIAALEKQGQGAVRDVVSKISAANFKNLEDYFSQGTTLTETEGPAKLAVDQGFGTLDYSQNPYHPRVKIDREKLADKLPELRKKAEAGDDLAAEAIRGIDDILKTQGDLVSTRKYIDTLVAQGKVQQAIDEAGGVGGFIAAKTETVKAQFDAGQITEAEYQQRVINEIAALRNLKNAPGGQAFGEKEAADLAKAEKEMNDLTVNRLKRQIDTARALRKTQGVGPQENLQASLAALHTPGLNNQQRLELLPQALEDVQATFDENLKNIRDPFKRAQAALDGFEIPPEIQALQVQKQLVDDTNFQQVGAKVANAVGSDFSTITQNVSDIVSTTDKTVKEAMLEIIDRKITELEQALTVIGATGVGAGAAGAIQAQIQALKDARNSVAGGPDTPVTEVKKLLPDMTEAEREMLEQTRARAAAALELAAAINEGNPEASAAIGIQQALAELNEVIADQGADSAAADQARAKLVRAQHQAVDVATNIAKANADYLKTAADGDPVKVAQAEIQAAYIDLQAATAKGDKAGIINAQASILSGRQAARDSANAIARSAIEVGKALAGDDPLAQALYDIRLADFDIATAKGQAERNQAIISKIEAQKQAQRALVELQKSRLDVTAAMVERDPLASARVALQQADLDAGAARTESEKNAALAARIRAQHAVEDAITAIAQSQSDLLAAYANYAGDSVEAARIGLDSANQALQRLISQGGGEAAINQQKIAVITAQGQLRDAQLQSRLGDVDFLLQMERITTGQAIEMLESVAQIPGLTQQQLREIQLKIKGLQQSLNQDFQFNIPTLDLQGLFYQANRVVQGQAAGQGYQDNRTFQIAVNGTGTPVAVANQIMTALGAAPGGNLYSPGPGKYN